MTLTSPSTDAALSELLDRDEISRLVYRLGTCLDDGRVEDLRDLLVADVTARTPGGVAEGIDAVVGQAARNHDPHERIQHAISGVLIDLEGDEATVRANLVVTFGRGELTEPPYYVAGGVYGFTARRTDDGWRLTSISTRPVWQQGSR